MAKNAQVKVELNAVDRATRVFQKVGKEADALKGKLDGMGSRVSGVLAGAGAGALGGAVGGGVAFSTAIKNAADFEYALFQTTKVTTESTEQIRKKILDLPAALGSATELTQGYYQTISAGVTDAAKAMEMLTTASKLSAVAEVTQGQAIQALSKMMAGFRGEIGSVGQAADLLLDIEQLGQASVKELIPVIGDLSGVSQTAGVSFKEMAAAVALLTQTAGSPAQAATQLRALEMSLLNTNETMQKVVESLGAKTARELVDKNGLAGALNLIAEASEKSGLSLAKVYGSSEAFAAASALGANKFKTYAETLAQVGTQAGRTDKSFELLMSTFTGVEREGVATFTNLLTLIGQEFLPNVKTWLADFNSYLQQNSDDVSRWGKSAAETLETLGAGVGGLVDLWKSLPDEITGPAGYGVVGAALFGKTGAVLGLAASLIKPIMNIGRAITAINNGDMSFWDFMFANAQELDQFLTNAENRKQGLAQNSASVLGGLASVIRSDSAAIDNSFDVLGGLADVIRPETETQKIASLPANYKPVTTGKKDEAAKAAAKAAREELKNLELVAEVLKELEQKTGQYGLSIEVSNQLIDEQAKLWLKAGVPPQYVEQLKEIRRLEASTDGLDKMKLGWMEFYSETMDWGTQAGSVLTGTVDSFASSLAEMAITGKASFSDLARSMASDLTKIATKMMLVYAIEKALGWAKGAIGKTPDVANVSSFNFSSSAGSSLALTPVSVGHDGWGLVGSSRPSNGYRAVPAGLFANAPRFHGGTGYIRPGEYPAILKAGERVLNPAETRAYQNGPRVNLIINNNASGVDVQTSQRENADGSLDIEATIVRVVDRDMNRRGGLINQSLRKNWGQRSIVTKR